MKFSNLAKLPPKISRWANNEPLMEFLVKVIFSCCSKTLYHVCLENNLSSSLLLYHICARWKNKKELLWEEEIILSLVHVKSSFPSVANSVEV
jgi:hypothetical protein